jgi:hypothetical protein
MSLAVLLLVVGAVPALVFVVYRLWRDCEYWRAQYQALDQKAREREQHLFDQMLKIKGFREVGSNLQPTKPAASAYPVVSEDDMEVLVDRVNERIEHNMITGGEAQILIQDVKYGKKTMAEVDKILWKRQQEAYTGSVQDVVE